MLLFHKFAEVVWYFMPLFISITFVLYCGVPSLTCWPFKSSTYKRTRSWIIRHGSLIRSLHRSIGVFYMTYQFYYFTNMWVSVTKHCSCYVHSLLMLLMLLECAFIVDAEVWLIVSSLRTAKASTYTLRLKSISFRYRLRLQFDRHAIWRSEMMQDFCWLLKLKPSRMKQNAIVLYMWIIQN